MYEGNTVKVTDPAGKYDVSGKRPGSYRIKFLQSHHDLLPSPLGCRDECVLWLEDDRLGGPDGNNGPAGFGEAAAFFRLLHAIRAGELLPVRGRSNIGGAELCDL